MSTRATGTIEMKTWDEQPYDETADGAKLARASVTNAIHGDIDGETTLEYLLAYADDDNASFVGMERVVGQVGGRSGSFVLQHSGTFENGAVRGVWSVAPGSGTGELRGLRGQGEYAWAGEHEQAMPFTLDYDVE